MGINVYKNKAVTIDHTHQERLDTSIDNNPTTASIDGLELTFVFRRKSSRKEDGDGNPLIYALKKIRGYSIVPMYERMFFDIAEEVCEKFRENINADYLMPVPSGHGVCGDFCGMLSQWFDIPSLEPDFLGKKTISQILQEADESGAKISETHERSYRMLLGRLRKADGDNEFQMKEVDVKLRQYFNPLMAIRETPELSEKRVLIVDDLMSSGTSLRCVAAILRERGAIVSQGVCLLSDLSVKH